MTARDQRKHGVGPSPYMGSCRRCGEVLKNLSPCALEVYIAAVRAFSRVHNRCQPGRLSAFAVPGIAKALDEVAT